MRPEGKAELEALRQVVLAWKEDYSRWAGATAPADFLAEVEEMVYPYLRRLYECRYIGEEQVREFWRFCEEQAKALLNS
ncbi:hypothetical protein [Desulfovirgula thermocuniculi]|uniref:hypothetical protein n=1 Tax=Desulfovirgula thermocuniculi TaxID=348842 RepID=UPI0003FCE207|nr:hypothetical protein [Desulfovirgula thermocuniculi]